MQVPPDGLADGDLLADVQDIVDGNIDTVLWSDREKGGLRYTREEKQEVSIHISLSSCLPLTQTG